MAVKLIVFVLCITLINEITSRSLPSYIKPCKRDDPNINECLMRLMENIRPYISKGIPEMHVLPLDPIMIPSVTLNQNSAGSVNFIALFTDLKGYGGKNFQIHKIKASIKNQSLEVDLNLPLFRIESRYEVNGQILVLPIKGNGKFVGNFSDQTNRFINENWTDLLQETRPLIEDTVDAIILGIFKPVIETFSMDDLFPV